MLVSPSVVSSCFAEYKSSIIKIKQQIYSHYMNVILACLEVFLTLHILFKLSY